MATTQQSIITVFTSEDNKARIADVLAGKQPMDFHWSAISVPSSRQAELFSANGLTVDLSDVAMGVKFQQVYRETCNPAKEDFSPCWIYEGYDAGDSGLTGLISLRLTNTQALGSYHVEWQGITDRFGDPLQQYGHNTQATLAASIDGSGQ